MSKYDEDLFKIKEEVCETCGEEGCTCKDEANEKEAESMTKREAIQRLIKEGFSKREIFEALDDLEDEEDFEDESAEPSMSMGASAGNGAIN